MNFGSLIFVFLLQFVYNTNSALLSPDSSTISTESYVIQNISKAQNISKDSVICNALKDCSVTCNTYQSCKELEIKLSGSSTLSLVCNNTEACDSLKVISTSMNPLNIDCKCLKACQNMEIYVEYIPPPVDPSPVDSKTRVNINCLASYACNHALFNISHMSHVSLNCMSEGSVSTNSCANVTLTTVLVSDVGIVCGQNDCFNLTANIDTSVTTHVNCADPYSCLNTNINAQNSGSLMVNCSQTYSCKSMNIMCPYLNRHSCHLLCKNYSSSCGNVSVAIPDEYEYEFLDLDCPVVDENGACSAIIVECLGDKENNLISYNSSLMEYQWCIHEECCPWELGDETEESENGTDDDANADANADANGDGEEQKYSFIWLYIVVALLGVFLVLSMIWCCYVKRCCCSEKVMVTVKNWRSPAQAGVTGGLNAPLMMVACDSESENVFTGGAVGEKVVSVGTAGYPRLSITTSSTVEGGFTQ